MVNHIRNLLLNTRSTAVDIALPGADYVDPSFIPVEQPKWAKTFRSILFGSVAEQAYLNYQVYECLKLMHATEFVNYVFDLDDRITYDIRVSPFLNVKYDVMTTDGIYLLGTDEASDDLGIAKKKWVISNDEGIVTVTLLQTGAVETHLSSVVQGNYIGPFTLPGSSAMFAVSYNPQPKGGAIDSITRPQKSWLDIYNRVLVTKPILEGLFAGADGEPCRTFFNLWQDHENIVYKLTGMLLAYCYKMEELRNG